MSSPFSQRKTLFRNVRVPAVLLSLSVVLLGCVVLFLGYSVFMRYVVRPPVEAVRAEDPKGKPIVVSVLNGCGSVGAASRFTDYLRARGYDVVEMQNYHSFEMDRSLVVDRIGARENAKRVAYALGIDEESVIQQINRDEYVDVTVVIGRDHNSLKPSQ
jgi:hypothetical protein